MPTLNDLPSDVLDNICRRVAAMRNDIERLSWWVNLEEYRKEYEEWPLDEEDYYTGETRPLMNMAFRGERRAK